VGSVVVGGGERVRSEGLPADDERRGRDRDPALAHGLQDERVARHDGHLPAHHVDLRRGLVVEHAEVREVGQVRTHRRRALNLKTQRLAER